SGDQIVAIAKVGLGLGRTWVEHQYRFGPGPFGVVVPISGKPEMQVALTVHENVLGCEGGSETAVVVVSRVGIVCEGRPPLIVAEIHQTSRPVAMAIGSQAVRRQCAGWTRRTVLRLHSGHKPKAGEREQRERRVNNIRF